MSATLEADRRLAVAKPIYRLGIDNKGDPLTQVAGLEDA